MKVGLFDHVERSDRPLATQFDERLKFAVAAEAAGIYCLHVAEHHATPLNMVPVPGIYLGAVARATSRMRLGPLVYLLPLYSPLRLIEEICMLDHLSHGRLDIGVGRGVSPFELNFHKVAHDKSREIFLDAFACISAGLTGETLNHDGPYFTYKNVPMALRPLQQPHPPFWYGSSNTIGAAWSGERGMHFAANGPTVLAKANIAAYREALGEGSGPAVPKPEFSGGTAIGLLRHIVVADTDAEARRIAKPAIAHHSASLNYLRKTQGAAPGAPADPRLNIHRGTTFEEWEQEGMAIAGSPATVWAAIERQAGELGINYLLSYLFFGAMTLEQALRSLELFRTEVMPKIDAL
jgi:alkanesulfonate monooxygenase SsuD/methylene tetrahydromethanopterin reductase-like flavin-dependent oxidoreductase (luciferase family)